MNLGNEFAGYSPILYFVFLVWSLFWKGLALWRASTATQRNWFVALLILNTAGIFDLVFLFRFAKKRLTLGEMKGWISKKSHK